MKLSKSKLRKLVKEELLNERTSLATFPQAPPRAGHLPGGYARVLGDRGGMPEPWYNKLGYEQVDFPVADNMYDPEEAPEVSQVTQVNPKKKSTHISDEMSKEAEQEREESNEKRGLKESRKMKLTERTLRLIVREELQNIMEDLDKKPTNQWIEAQNHSQLTERESELFQAAVRRAIKDLGLSDFIKIEDYSPKLNQFDLRYGDARDNTFVTLRQLEDYGTYFLDVHDDETRYHQAYRVKSTGGLDTDEDMRQLSELIRDELDIIMGR